MRYTVALSILLSGCFSAPKPETILKDLPTYQPTALQEPIEKREADTLPEKTGQPTALSSGVAAPFTGILIDGYLLSKYKLIVSERDKLRELITIERESRSGVQSYLNKIIADALSKSHPTWWDENKGWVGFVGGVVAASALAIGLGAAFSHVK